LQAATATHAASLFFVLRQISIDSGAAAHGQRSRLRFSDPLPDDKHRQAGALH